MVQKGQMAKVSYVGTFDDGTVFDSTEKQGGKTFDFIVGSGNVIPGFEKAVLDMEIGDSAMVTIEPADAYGEYDLSKLQTEKIEDVPGAAELARHVGEVVYLQDRGDYIPATVVSAENGNITVDFNHPMAGKRLNFAITLEGVDENPVNPHGAVPEPGKPAKPGEKA